MARILTPERMLEYKRSYQQACGSETTALMMEDLADFCCADRSCFNYDPYIHAVLAGRREVWIRIQQHLNLTPDELLDIFGAITTKPRTGNEFIGD